MKLPDYYEFLCRVKFISGRRVLEGIPTELEGYGAARPLVLCSHRESDAGLSKILIQSFNDSNCVLGAIFDECPETATLSIVKELSVLYRKRECDSIIALGGGSVIHIAKGLNMAVSEKKDLLKLVGSGKISPNLKPLYIVPTLSLDGYETSNYAYIDEKEYDSVHLSPDAVVIDPRMLSTASPEVVVNSAFIALTHAIEASAVQVGNPMSDYHALASIQYISENLKKSFLSPSDKKSALALVNACSMAGIAFSNAPAGMVHHCARALSVLKDVHPGICMAVLLPVMLEYKLFAKKEIRDELLLAMAGLEVYAQTSARKRVSAALGKVKSLVKDFPEVIPGNLKAMGFVEKDLKQAASDAVAASGKILKIKECMNVLNRAWNGSSFKK